MSVRTDTVVVSLTGEMQAGPLERFMLVLRQALERAGATPGSNGDDADLVLNVVDRGAARSRSAASRAARSSRRCTTARRAAAHDERCARVPDARPRPREHRPLLRAAARRLLHDDGARALPRPRGRRPRALADAVVERLAPLATLASRDRERVPHRPRARALGRRRGHRRDRARRAAGSTRSACCRRRSRSRSCSASATCATSSGSTAIGGLSYGNLSARKDATPLLDERERRRQVEARRARAATSCS